MDTLFKELDWTVPPNDCADIQNQMGDILFEKYAYLPLFHLYIEFVADPDIIES